MNFAYWSISVTMINSLFSNNLFYVYSMNFICLLLFGRHNWKWCLLYTLLSLVYWPLTSLNPLSQLRTEKWKEEPPCFRLESVFLLYAWFHSISTDVTHQVKELFPIFILSNFIINVLLLPVKFVKCYFPKSFEMSLKYGELYWLLIECYSGFPN